MKPDGTINTALWQDFAERSLHEMADKSKALAKLFYGKPHKFAYWDGFSTGGRQGLKLAQVYPNDFDGILSGAPAINWTRFITNELYPQVAMQRDLGAALSGAKLNALTSASLAACGGATRGFLLDPYACRYDPTQDAAALCSGVTGNGGVTGSNADASTCVNLAEARVVNKIWYGQTADGSVPDPATDNAAGPDLASSNQLWFGLTRGTFLGLLAGDATGPFGGLGGPFPIAADQVALELQDPSIGSLLFTNAVSNGIGNWKNLSYAQLTVAGLQGLVLQQQFANINTDNPDLTAFNNHKGKLLMYHGLADNLIAPQGSDNYYSRVMATMGGQVETQKFFRYFRIPGMAHSGRLEAGPNVPVPQTALGRDEMFQALQSWVENGTTPGRIDVSSSDASVSLPMCLYPQKVNYSGSGSVTAAASYTCQ
jgi:Tannase and feruloyl esterase